MIFLCRSLHCKLVWIFSNDDGDAEDDVWQKKYFYFTLKCRNCVDLFSTPTGQNAQSKYVMIVFNSKERHEKLAIAVQVLQTTYDFVISRCCFAEDGEKMYKDSKRTCKPTVSAY